MKSLRKELIDKGISVEAEKLSAFLVEKLIKKANEIEISSFQLRLVMEEKKRRPT